MSSNKSSDISNLQENFFKQQAKISALKELVRKSEAAHGKSTSSAQEKVKSIAQRLTHLKSKARARQNLERSFSELNEDAIIEESSIQSDAQKTPLSLTSEQVRARSETPCSEKIQLLRQQLEQNKLKIAKRESNKREIEEMVIQLKAQIDNTQQSLEKSSELGRSMGDLTTLTSTPIKSRFNSSTDLNLPSLNLDKERIKFLENRVRLLEKQLEKERNVPKTENEATEKITQLQSTILDLEESLKEKECIIDARTQAVGLMSENLSAKSKTTVETLEDTRQEMFKMQKNFLEMEDNYKTKIQYLIGDLNDKTQKIENLENINAKLIERSKNDDIEKQKVESEGTNIAKKLGEEYANKIQELQDKIEKLEKENDDLKIFAQQSQTAPKNVEINSMNDENQIEVQNLLERIKSLDEQLQEKTIECNVLNANFSVLQEKVKASTPKSLFSKSVDDSSELEINKLKSQLDESNKNMIKMKLKMKQLQKEVDSFKKISDVHSEVLRLTEENQSLQQKISELEEEKRKLQSKLTTGTSGAEDSELEKKIQILETTCQNQTSAIQLLEEQKLDMTENLNTTKQELESLKDHIQEIDKEETARVVSHMETIQLEEQINDYEMNINEMNQLISNQKSEIEKLHENMELLEKEKTILSKKVDHYIAENIELLDKIEKLSKSSSSAESIEIVERLTQQEKLEIEAFNKRLQEEQSITTESLPIIGDSVSPVIEQELSESLTKLREESSELMEKIELFTTERREVLEKMEGLTSENQEHVTKINQLLRDKLNLEKCIDSLKSEAEETKKKYEENLIEKENLRKEINETIESKNQLVDELHNVIKEKKSMQEMYAKENIVEDCKKSLSRLNSELENYKKSNDKSSKLNSSKKLAKEAKNVHHQMNDLLKQLKIGKSTDNEIEFDANNLLRKCQELEIIVENIQKEFIFLKDKSILKDDEIKQINSELSDKKVSYQNHIISLENLRKELEYKLQTSNNEVEILKTLVNEQKEQLITTYTEHEYELNKKLELIDRYENEIKNLKGELKMLNSEKNKSMNQYNKKLESTIEELQEVLRNNEILLNEQSSELQNRQCTIDTLNKQIIELYKTMEENTNKVIEKDDEIAYIQELYDSNKIELDKTIKENEDNKKVIEKLLVELHLHSENRVQLDAFKSLELKNGQLETRTQELEKINNDLMERNKEQHEKLKKLAANLKKKVTQYNELEKKMNKLEEQPKIQIETNMLEAHNECKQKIGALENELKRYQEEYESLKLLFDQQNQHYESDITGLRGANQNLIMENSNLLQQCNDFEVKLISVEEECENLKRYNIELENLKVILHKDIEEKQKMLTELQYQINLHLENLKEKEINMNNMRSEISVKNQKFDKCKTIIKERNKEIQKLNKEIEKLKELQNNVSDDVKNDEKEIYLNLQKEYEKLKDDYVKLNEKYENEKKIFQDTILRLETVHDGIQAKLHEDMGYIESLEVENNKYKEKIQKLEECLALFEEKRLSLESRTKLLDSQLQKKTDEYEKNEDALVHRLNTLSEHDDLIGRRLLEAQEENEELMDKLKRLKEDHVDLLNKFSVIEKEFNNFKSEEYNNIKAENQILKQQIDASKTEITKLQQNFDFQLAQKHAEIDELENELSIQLQSINVEKRSLQENLEKSKDEIIELKDENVRLKENVNALEQIKNDFERENTWIKMQNDNLSQDQMELQELRMQVIQDKTEIDNLKHQLDSLIQNHEIELNSLRVQISDLDSMRMQVSQNQTDDQVFIETENKKLKELLAEKEAMIESYQRQNLQLQMASTASVAQHLDSFFNLSDTSNPSTSQTDDQFTENMEIVALTENNQKLENELIQLKLMNNEKDNQIKQLKEELNELTKINSDLQNKFIDKQKEIDNLKLDLDKFNRPLEISSVFSTEQPSTSIFDEIFTSRNVSTLEGPPQVQDQKKIEDLERNVSDLEKYAADLENKLKNLTSIHEETINQMHEKSRVIDETVNNYEEKIRKLEERIIELQIINEENLNVTKKVETVVDFPTNPNNEPIFEEPIIPKKAYICQPDSITNEPLLLESHEDWAWGSEDASLEAKHYALSATESINQQSEAELSLKNKLKEYQERIQELELERNRLDEQKVELQVKSGKMMKKLKEYKNKIDQLTASSSSSLVPRKSSSVESNDLDLAIQEELKCQLDSAESKLVETKKQLDKELLEKENLLKRIEVLSAGNDRMLEMKEKQDSNIKMYQSEIYQLNEKIKSLSEWNTSPKKGSNLTEICLKCSEGNLTNTNEELVKEIEDLKIDRDELQALLNEEKEIRSSSEHKNKELQTKIMMLEELIENRETELRKSRTHETEKQSANVQLIDELRSINHNLQSQLNEYQSVINQLSNESNLIKLQLDKLNEEHKKKLDENDNLSKKLQEWIDKENNMSKEIEIMHCKTEEHELESIVIEQELNAALQYKEDEIYHLKQKIESMIKEDQTQSLIEEISIKNQEINVLKENVEELENEKIELQQKLTSAEKNNVNNELEAKLKDKITSLETELKSIKSEKDQMEEELRVLNNHVISSIEIEDKMKQAALELDLKNIEIAELKNSLEVLKEKHNEHSNSNHPSQDNLDDYKLKEINSQWEAIVEEKCKEITERWKQNLEQKENEFRRIETELREKLKLSQVSSSETSTPSHSEINKNIVSLETLNVDDVDKNHEDILRKMQTVLENQELEIVTLKEQLAMRSAEYASLAAKHDPFGQTTTSNSIFELLKFNSQKQLPVQNVDISGSTTSETVPKSELDLSMYRLHQREMRCEELTLELVNLLEERDTLQLKLSNSLRMIEEIKQKTGYVESGDDLKISYTDSPTRSRSQQGNVTVDDNNLIENNELNQKLSQLHAGRENRLRDDDRQKEMERIQQDIAKIPPEAVSELMGTDLSNMMESPSTVLLNWLWGKNHQ